MACVTNLNLKVFSFFQMDTVWMLNVVVVGCWMLKFYGGFA